MLMRGHFHLVNLTTGLASEFVAEIATAGDNDNEFGDLINRNLSKCHHFMRLGRTRSFFWAGDYIRFSPASMQIGQYAFSMINKCLSNVWIGDIICTFIGAGVPVVLRPAFEATYTLIGEYYIHGLMNGESLLGSLPSSGQLLFIADGTTFKVPGYWNLETNSLGEDPRLENMLPNWEKIEVDHVTNPNLPILYVPHKNKLTGEVINSDPRLLPEVLIARGVKLEQFFLI